MVAHQVIPLRCPCDAGPEKVVEGGRATAIAFDLQLFGVQSFLLKAVPKAQVHIAFVQHRKCQVSGAEDQAGADQFPASPFLFMVHDGQEEGDQEGKGIERVDHEDGLPSDRSVKGPQKLGPPGGEAIEEGMGEEDGECEKAPTEAGGRDFRMDLGEEVSEQDRKRDEESQRVARPPMELREAHDVHEGIGHDIQIRQCSQEPSPKPGFMSSPPTDACFTYGCPEAELGQRIQRAKVIYRSP